MPQKLTLDTLYASRNRLSMDVRIIFWTVMTVIIGKPVAVNRTSGRMNIRRRKQPWSPAQRQQLLPQQPGANRSDPSAHESAA
jgi:hypothetical protein